MSSKRHLRRKSCEGKIRHADKGGAVQQINSLWRLSHEHMRPYHCRFCGGWHVGHKSGLYR